MDLRRDREMTSFSFFFFFTFSYISLDQNNKQQCFLVTKCLLPIVSYEHYMHTCNEKLDMIYRHK